MMRTATAASLVAGLLVVVGPSTATAGSGSIEFGRVWRDDGRLHHGCHSYRYHYRAKPKTSDWGLETFLRDPRGETIASGGLAGGADPKRGVATFRFCRWNTRPGAFKIAGKLTWYDGYDKHVHWVKPGWFRLRKPR